MKKVLPVVIVLLVFALLLTLTILFDAKVVQLKKDALINMSEDEIGLGEVVVSYMEDTLLYKEQIKELTPEELYIFSEYSAAMEKVGDSAVSIAAKICLGLMLMTLIIVFPLTLMFVID